jgi:hypothetical protein
LLSLNIFLGPNDDFLQNCLDASLIEIEIKLAHSLESFVAY